jgi:tRNA (guanine6-N2)-methyltransferase
MFKYKLQIIPGTKDFVVNEIRSKLPDVVIESNNKSLLFVESPKSDIDQFRVLYTALRVANDEGIDRNLFRREWRKFTSPAGMNPALAYILCTLGEINSEDVVLDPFCGGGTIAVSAALYFNPKKVLASDLSGTSIDYTLGNFKEAKIKKNKYAVFRSNISQLKLQKDYVSKVITNLPFGIRVGDHENNLKVYKSFAGKMNSVVKSGGKLVIFTQEKKLLLETFNKSKFELAKTIEVDQGGLKPDIFVYNKL